MKAIIRTFYDEVIVWAIFEHSEPTTEYRFKWTKKRMEEQSLVDMIANIASGGFPVKVESSRW